MSSSATKTNGPTRTWSESNAFPLCLALENVSRDFGGLKAVDGVSLAIRPGERRAVIGPNGAGKTTLFNLISGELRPTAGKIMFLGADVAHLPPHSRAARGIARTFQVTRLFANLTVLENVLLAAEALDRRKFTMYRRLSSFADLARKAADLLDQFGLGPLRQERARDLSYGNQRKLELALSMAGRPRLLLLDEPMAGLSPGESGSVQAILERLDPAAAVLLIEHDMDMAFGFAETITVLYQGRVLATGNKDDIRLNSDVREIYLGLSVLSVRDVHTYYGDSHVLQGVNLEVERGTVASVLGRNGMGKTTLCRSLVGLTPARAGRIVFNDTEITHLPAHKIWGKRIGLVPQGRRVFASLTVREHLAIAGRRGQPLPAPFFSMTRIFTLFPRLEERGHHRGNELSGGEQQMLAIARALVSGPVLLVMDEPTEGLAPALVADVATLIRQLKREGTSVLLVEQNAAFAVQVSDYVHVMSRGRIVHSCEPMALWGNEELKAQYLGVPPSPPAPGSSH